MQSSYIFIKSKIFKLEASLKGNDLVVEATSRNIIIKKKDEEDMKFFYKK